MTQPKATVGVLLYGDHPDLAERCLKPLWPLQRSGLIELRIGCNAVGDATLGYLASEGAMLPDVPTVRTILSETNVHKYPMMRTLIGLAPLAPFFMWFDDDSYIDAPDPAAVVERALVMCEPHTMVGQVWTFHLVGNQHLWVKDQPWYAGRHVHKGHKVMFCQGAWWVIPSATLYKHDWPVPELVRKGGDVMLGELCHQQGIVLRNVGHNFGVRINADEKGQHSKMPTRGPMPLPQPIGFDYQPGVAARVLDTLADAP